MDRSQKAEAVAQLNAVFNEVGVVVVTRNLGLTVAQATDRIQTGMPGGGYILSTACSVAPRVEPWKLELLTPLAEEIGRYD